MGATLNDLYGMDTPERPDEWLQSFIGMWIRNVCIMWGFDPSRFDLVPYEAKRIDTRLDNFEHEFRYCRDECKRHKEIMENFARNQFRSKL